MCLQQWFTPVNCADSLKPTHVETKHSNPHTTTEFNEIVEIFATAALMAKDVLSSIHNEAQDRT